MDLDRVESLLNVAEMARNYPNLKPLLDEALKELAKANYELEKKAQEEQAKAESSPKSAESVRRL
jgi:hypothetical protein